MCSSILLKFIRLFRVQVFLQVRQIFCMVCRNRLLLVIFICVVCRFLFFWLLMNQVVWCVGQCCLFSFSLWIICLIKCCWLLVLMILKFCGRFVFCQCWCNSWWVMLWKVFIYMLLVGMLRSCLIWLCIFVVVLLVNVMVRILNGDVCLVVICQVIWCISIRVLFELVLVSISRCWFLVVIVLC